MQGDICRPERLSNRTCGTRYSLRGEELLSRRFGGGVRDDDKGRDEAGPDKVLALWV